MTSAAKKDDGDDSKIFADELAPGTELLKGAYVIERFLNSGGFGITYLARDSLDRSVVIKECFPGSFCRRSNTIVGARSRAHQNEFRSIVKLFVQEARSLSKLKHPNIVGVHQVFEDNDTAYMALDYVEGNDLLDILEDPKQELGANQIQSIMKRILGAVAFIHDQGVLHRDISPDNILIDGNDNPVLIDFGAAREEATKASRVLSALRVVKDGYSPQEFYIQGSDQAPSSDLYALGASFFHLITGETPPNSQNRLAAIAAGDKDPYDNLAGRIKGYEKGFLEAIDKALNVFPKDRIQSAGDWMQMISAPQSKAPFTAEDTIQKTVVDLVSKNSDIEAKQPRPKEAKADVKTPAPAKPVKLEKPIAPAIESPAVENPVVGRPAVERVDAPVADVHATSAAPIAAPEQNDEGSKLGLLLGSAAAIAIIAVIAATQLGGDEETSEADIENATVAAPVVTQDVAATDTPSAAPVADVDASPVIADDSSVTGAAELAETIEVPAPVADVVSEQIETELTLVTPPLAEPEIVEDAGAVSSGFVADANDLLADQELALAAPDPAPQPQAETEPEPDVVEPSVFFDETPPELITDLVRPIARPDAGDAFELGSLSDQAVARADFSSLDAGPSPTGGDVSEIDTQTATPAPGSLFVEEQSVLELAAVMSGWSTPVPFSGNDTSGLVVETVDPSISNWLQPGQEIVLVNGLRITSLDQVEKVVRSTTDLTNQSQVEALITYRKEAGGELFEQNVSLDVVREIALLNGTRFQITREDDGWMTVVTESAEQGDGALLPGDQVVSYIRTGVAVDGPVTLQDILEAELAEGRTSFNFAVLRDGATWLASMNYEAAIDD